MYTPNETQILKSIKQYLDKNVTMPFIPLGFESTNVYCVTYQTSDGIKHSKLFTSETDATRFRYYICNCIRNEFLTKYDIQPRRTR